MDKKTNDQKKQRPVKQNYFKSRKITSRLKRANGSSGFIGLKESVKRGKIRVKDAIAKLIDNGDKSVAESHTFKWLIGRMEKKIRT